MDYLKQKIFSINVGFRVEQDNIVRATELTNMILADLPATLYRSLDFKTVSAVIGSIFCDVLAKEAHAIVNPIEKGHPDILPETAAGATEAELRNYPCGLEIKCTIGNITQGANLRAGQRRIDQLTGITWQAHHREVTALMGLVWDFANQHDTFLFPAIVGIFYADNLNRYDWGEVSGTTGRNTKVSGMLVSGKVKMAAGWVMLHKDDRYFAGFSRTLGTPNYRLPSIKEVARA